MNPVAIMVLLGGMIFFMLLGIPLAFSIFGISTVVLALFTRLPVWQLIQRFLGGVDSFVLTAIPFFLLCGNIMNSGKITDKLTARPEFILISTEVKGYRKENHAPVPEAFDALGDTFLVDYVRVFDRK